MRVLVPGQADLVLKEPGTYTIFHEYQSTFEGRVYDVDDRFRTQHHGARAAARVVPLTRPRPTRAISVGSYAGRSLFDFEVRDARHLSDLRAATMADARSRRPCWRSTAASSAT